MATFANAGIPLRDGMNGEQIVCSTLLLGMQYPCSLIYGMAGSTPKAINVDPATGDIITMPAGASTAASGTPVPLTLTTAGTWYQALASNTARKGCVIQNTSGATMYVYIGDGSPDTAHALMLGYPGGSFDCAHPGGLTLTDQIRVMSNVSASTAVAVSQ